MGWEWILEMMIDNLELWDLIEEYDEIEIAIVKIIGGC